MKKFTFSFLIAVGLHIIILLFSGLIIDDKQNNFFVNQNLIPVQFGKGTKTSVSKTVRPKSTSQQVALTKKNGPASFEMTSNSGPAEEVSDGGQGGLGAGPGTSFEAMVVSYKGPAYPRVAQMRGLQGNVRIRIKVSAEGEGIETTLLKSSGHGVLDQAVMEIVPQWKFLKNSSPYFVEKNIVFKLKD